jgi:integrase
MAKARKIDITDAAVAAIPFETQGERFYADRSLKGFSLRVGKRSNVFSCRADFYRDGRRAAIRRIRLGAVGEISADLARAKALEAMRRVKAVGRVDTPDRPENTSLRDVWVRYQAAMRKADCGERTIADYGDKLRLHMSDWMDRPLGQISRDEAHRRHADVSEKRGPYAANGSMRVARALFNFGADNLELPGLPARNPFRSTRRDSLYAKEVARNDGLATAALPGWAAQLRELPTLRAAMHLFTLMSGMRRTTVLTMRWIHVDWATATLAVPAPKGGKPMLLPLSRPMLLLLRHARRLGRMLLGQDSPWVWPSPESESGHMTEVKERKLSAFGHRLRSSYATIAEEAGVSIIARKALMAHAIPNDVTQKHYINRAALAPEFRKAQAKISTLIVATVAPDARRAQNIVGRAT